jgi:hypothetical protein
MSTEPFLNQVARLIARAIREQITRARQPENLRRIVGLSDELFNRATETGRLFWWWPAEGAVGVNNMYKADMRSGHFGYPDSLRICKCHLYSAQSHTC